jgi:hypothetical protein
MDDARGSLAGARTDADAADGLRLGPRRGCHEELLHRSSKRALEPCGSRRKPFGGERLAGLATQDRRRVCVAGLEAVAGALGKLSAGHTFA